MEYKYMTEETANRLNELLRQTIEFHRKINYKQMEEDYYKQMKED